jgi:hypothetical protein
MRLIVGALAILAGVGWSLVLFDGFYRLRSDSLVTDTANQPNAADSPQTHSEWCANWYSRLALTLEPPVTVRGERLVLMHVLESLQECFGFIWEPDSRDSQAFDERIPDLAADAVALEIAGNTYRPAFVTMCQKIDLATTTMCRGRTIYADDTAFINAIEHQPAVPFRTPSEIRLLYENDIGIKNKLSHIWYGNETQPISVPPNGGAILPSELPKVSHQCASTGLPGDTCWTKLVALFEDDLGYRKYVWVLQSSP